VQKSVARTIAVDGRLPADLRDRVFVRAAELRRSVSAYTEGAVSYGLTHHPRRPASFQLRDIAAALPRERVRQSLNFSERGHWQLGQLGERMGTSANDALCAALVIAEEEPLSELAPFLPPDARRRAAVG
jgi:hypothetical protein